MPASAAVLQRGDLGVEPSYLGVEPFADHLPAAHENRADERVGTDATAPAFGQDQRPSQVDPIALCDDGGHD